MSILLDFAIEAVIRFFSKTPWFFKVIQVITVIVAVITGLPEFLFSAGVDLPDAWDAVSSKIISVAAVIGTIVAQFTTTIQVKESENLKD
jgi:type III secretory pathway component EscS